MDRGMSIVRSHSSFAAAYNPDKGKRSTRERRDKDERKGERVTEPLGCFFPELEGKASKFSVNAMEITESYVICMVLSPQYRSPLD